MNEPNPLLDTLRSHVRDLEVRIAEAERDTQNRGNVLAAAIAAADKARDDAIAAARSARNEAVAKARAASPAMNLTALRRERKVLLEAVDKLDPKPQAVACPDCPYKARNAAGLGAHRWTAHGIRGTSPTATHNRKTPESGRHTGHRGRSRVERAGPPCRCGHPSTAA